MAAICDGSMGAAQALLTRNSNPARQQRVLESSGLPRPRPFDCALLMLTSLGGGPGYETGPSATPILGAAQFPS
jgi:hypothetical protein